MAQMVALAFSLWTSTAFPGALLLTNFFRYLLLLDNDGGEPPFVAWTIEGKDEG